MQETVNNIKKNVGCEALGHWAADHEGLAFSNTFSIIQLQ